MNQILSSQVAFHEVSSRIVVNLTVYIGLQHILNLLLDQQVIRRDAGLTDLFRNLSGRFICFPC